MKRRLRKKLHKGEFQQYGISILVPANAENVDAILDAITDIADRHSLLFSGGGLGRLIVPSAEYGEMKIPSKVVSVLLSIAKEPTALSDCVVGFFVNPSGKEITAGIADEVNAELEKVLNADFKINRKVGLWE
jgi:hypothetical protein